jgi:hypothetical protein
MGSFCNIDWKLQQKNPSTVAMFRDLQDQSKMCQGTILKMDLYDITRRAQKYDAAVQNSTTLAQQKVTSFSVPPTGVVFHETRCGSTLTANLLASFSPLHTKVYSESPPPLTALKACDGKNCNKDLHLRLIQDVFYMMGRTTRVERPQFIFYKFQSIGSHHIQTFTKAFPDTPWVFLYRDSIEVMHSHLQGPNSKLIGRGNPVCARAYGREGQPEITKELIEYKGKQVQDVTIPEYCAAHLVRIFLSLPSYIYIYLGTAHLMLTPFPLVYYIFPFKAGLSESAIREHERTGKGRFVNYNQLPDILWEQVMPQDFKVPITDVMITNMKNVAQVYSKGRGRNANKSWEEDSTRKKQTASTEVVEATHMFMDRPFQRMEGFAAGGR